MSNEKLSFGQRIKEGLRKFAVSLKRQPSNIPLVVFAVNYLYYSLNLTTISNTTAKLQGANMGLCGFCANLFSILMLVCFLNAFPKRKKVNKPMLVLVFVMAAIIIFADIYYIGRVNFATTRPDNPFVVTEATAYIYRAVSVLINHVIIMGVGLLLTITLPFYKKLLAKINTSITVEGNSGMGEIELAGEE